MCVLSEFGGHILPAMCASDYHQRHEAHGPSRTLTGKSVSTRVVSETGGFESANGADGQGRASIDACVCIGRLQLGRQGPVAQLSLDGFTDVRVDHFGSFVSSPFSGGCSLTVCQAYDELVRMVLTTPLAVDDCLDTYDTLKLQLSLGDPPRPSSFELEMLSVIAERHGVSVRKQVSSPSVIGPWLAYHAKLLLEGASFRLLDTYMQGGDLVPPWTCHAQSLQGALLWVAITHQGKLLERRPSLVAHDSIFPQVGLTLTCRMNILKGLLRYKRALIASSYV